MPRQQLTEDQKQEILKALKISRNTCEYKRLQCLQLRFIQHMKLKEIGEIVGYNPKAVGNIIAKYFKNGLDSMLGEKRKGGNKRYLTVEEENALLEPFLKRAEQGRLLIVAEIHEAYEEAVGRKVPASTIYRMLARNNWRKVMPRSKHPKADPASQEAYKKNQRES